jgi:hypothetical protein
MRAAPAVLGVLGAGLMMALAWRCILAHLQTQVSRKSAFSIYGLSQISKYVPGNVFQFLGRQALGAAKGIPDAALAKSCLWELGTVFTAGAVFVPLILPLCTIRIAPVIAAAIFATLLVGCFCVIRRLLGQAIASAFLWHEAALATLGSVFAACTVFLLPPAIHCDAVMLVTLIAAYVAAWMAGLVTPGAPAGLGVRETVLLLLLQKLLPESRLLPAILVTRLVNVAGDCLFYLIPAVATLKRWPQDRRQATSLGSPGAE